MFKGQVKYDLAFFIILKKIILFIMLKLNKTFKTLGKRTISTDIKAKISVHFW